MIGHPAIVKRLNWMLGYGFRESTEPMCCVCPAGTTGGSLHGQNPAKHEHFNGRQLVEQVNVAWALQDESPGFGKDSGGFICVPGSHKAKYPISRGLTTSIDLPQVYKPAMKAGDVLFFGGVAHGTTAWHSSWHRRTTIQFMGSRNVALPPGKTSAAIDVRSETPIQTQSEQELRDSRPYSSKSSTPSRKISCTSRSSKVCSQSS